MAHELQTRYSQLVDEKLRAELVLKDGVVFNNRYEGNPKAGAVKIPVRDGEVESQDYSRTTGVDLTFGSTEYLTLVISKDKAVNELIDGYEADAVPDDLIADRLDSAGYSQAVALDTDGMNALITGTGTFATNTTTALTASTVYSYMVDLATAMDNAYVPNDGRRFVLVTPNVKGLLLKDTVNFIRQGDISQELVKNGVFGQVAGLNVIVTPRLPAKVEAIGGHPDWCTRVREWLIPVKLESLNQSGKFIGASAVQGRAIFAHTLTKPKTVFVKKTA